MTSKDYEKVFLHDDGEDLESCWAEPLGTSKQGRTLVRLANIPFLHARPTYGDIIEVARDPSYAGNFAWDRGGLPLANVGERIHRNGGRYVAIIDYLQSDGADFNVLTQWLKEQDVVGEGYFGQEGARPGRLYLAVPDSSEIEDILAAMEDEFGNFTFTRVHPPAAARAKVKVKAKAKAKPKKKSAPKKKPAKKKKR